MIRRLLRVPGPRITVLLGVLAGLVFAAVGAAGAAAGPLSEALRARQARVDALLAKGSERLTDAERKQIGDVLAELVDFAAMGETALGAEWARRTEAERRDYLKAFEDLVRANVLRRLDLYQGDTVMYLDETEADGQGVVTTSVQTKDATTEVTYTFRRQGETWKIVDYAVDGISTARNYRAQFGKVLRQDGFQALLERLQKRKDELEGKP